MKTYREILTEMSKTDQRELESRITTLIEHVLKLRYVTGQVAVYNNRGWNKTLTTERREIATLVKRTPGLKSLATKDLLDNLYESALVNVQVDFPTISLPQNRQLSLDEIVGAEVATKLSKS